MPGEEESQPDAAAEPTERRSEDESRARALRLARRKAQQRKRTGAVLVFIIAGIITALIIIYFEFIHSTPGPSADVTKGIKLGPLPAGRYEDAVTKGYSKRGFVKVRVSVTVFRGKIESITILSHRHLSPKATAAADEIVNRIMEKQSTSVDAVSGATVSSRAIMLAVQDALNNNQAKKWEHYDKTGEGGRMKDKY